MSLGSRSFPGPFQGPGQFVAMVYSALMFHLSSHPLTIKGINEFEYQTNFFFKLPPLFFQENYFYVWTLKNSKKKTLSNVGKVVEFW